MKSRILAGASIAGVAAMLAAPVSAFDGAAPAVQSLSIAPADAGPPPDPQRWQPLAGLGGTGGPMSYLDQSAVRRRGTEVGVVVMRNAPVGMIRTTSGEPIRSSLKRIVLNCALSTYAIVEQTLFPKRFARGEALYTIAAPHGNAMQPASGSRLATELLGRLCR